MERLRADYYVESDKEVKDLVLGRLCRVGEYRRRTTEE